MAKVITTKSAVQSDPNDDHYTKIVTFIDEEETDVYIPFPLEKTTTSPFQKSQSHQLRQLPLALKELFYNHRQHQLRQPSVLIQHRLHITMHCLRSNSPLLAK